MSDDGEEDFIPAHSPLYEYFEQPLPSKKENKNNSDHSHNVKVTKRETLRSIISAVLFIPREVYTTFSNYVYRYIEYLHRWTQYETFDKIFSFCVNSTALLIPEDVSFLENFLCDRINGKFQEGRMCKAVLISSSVLNILCLLALLHFSGCFSFWFLGYFNSTSLYVVERKALLFSSASTFSFISYYWILCITHSLKCYKLKKQTNLLCLDIKSSLFFIKKSLKLIQERELIASGFMSTTALNVAQRLELSMSTPLSLQPNKQFLELRKNLFIWMKALFMAYRTGTCNLIKFLPVPVDGMTACFATMRLSEFNGLLNYDPEIVEDYSELCKVSDDLSLSFLKAVYQLMEVQLSEFLCRFCLSVLCSFEKVNYFDTFEKIDVSVAILKEVRVDIDAFLPFIKQVYSYHRSLGDLDQSKRPVNVCRSSNTTSNLCLAIHDLNFHVKSALMRAIAIEDLMNEEISLLNKNEELSYAVLQKLDIAIVNMKSSISLSDDFCDRCCQLINQRKNVSDDRQFDTSGVPVNGMIPEEENAGNMSDENEEMQDEVFEAFIEECYSGCNTTSEICDDYRAKNKLERLTASFLMQELKSVLQVKAEEHRCREEKVLKSKYALKETSESSIVKQTVMASTKSQNSQTIETQKFDKTTSGNKTCCNDYGMERNTLESLQILPPFDLLLEMKTESFASTIARLASSRGEKCGLKEVTLEYDNQCIIEDNEISEGDES